MDFIFKNVKGFLFVSDYKSNGIDGKDSGISTHLSVPNIYWKEATEPTNKKKTFINAEPRAGFIFIIQCWDTGFGEHAHDCPDREHSGLGCEMWAEMLQKNPKWHFSARGADTGAVSALQEGWHLSFFFFFFWVEGMLKEKMYG